MIRHFVFIFLVVAFAVAVTQFGSLRLEASAERFLPEAALAFYDTWIPPPPLFTFKNPGMPIVIGGAAIFVRLAGTPEEQSVGLGGLRRVREDEGMLYLYPRPDFYTHSMKDMRFPLDIIWIDTDKKIVDVITNVLPDTYPDYAYVNDFLAQYVLEIRAGFFDAHKLKIGDVVEFEIEEAATK